MTLPHPKQRGSNKMVPLSVTERTLLQSKFEALLAEQQDVVQAIKSGKQPGELEYAEDLLMHYSIIAQRLSGSTNFYIYGQTEFSIVLGAIQYDSAALAKKLMEVLAYLGDTTSGNIVIDFYTE